MFRTFAMATLLLAASWATADPVAITVDCGAGRSLSAALAKLDKSAPATVTVKGTCTEFVQVEGFNGLTLNGLPGAALQQPASNPQGNAYVLSIYDSQAITVNGLAVNSLSTIFSGIGIGGGSHGIRLQNVATDGSWGIVVYEACQVWLVNVTVNITSGYAGIAAYDKSDVHIVNGSIGRPADSNFYAGIAVGSGHITMQGTTIRDMQQGISIDGSGSVDLVYFDSIVAAHDVIINNPAGTNLNGVIVSDASSLNLGNIKLRIAHAGQSYGSDTGAVLVTNGSTMNAGANLIVSGSQGQGVMVANNSHATLAGSSITGGAHGGLVVVNLSTAGATEGSALTTISGNAADLFCDSKSQIAGTANIANATSVQCANLLSGDYEALP
ncbi:MAG TPA: hypothetical protein VMH04_09975 [Candidatus Solibacter sp.]|nr:hypothetical protein [Candidatus Solibacter sp.]